MNEVLKRLKTEGIEIKQEDLARLSPLDFKYWYNQQRIHNSIAYQTPWHKLSADVTLSSPVLWANGALLPRPYPRDLYRFDVSFDAIQEHKDTTPTVVFKHVFFNGGVTWHVSFECPDPILTIIKNAVL